MKLIADAWRDFEIEVVPLNAREDPPVSGIAVS